MATKKRRSRGTVAEPTNAQAEKDQGIVLRLLKGAPIELQIPLNSAEIAKEARQWNYRLRDRRRWAARAAGVNELRNDARKFVDRLGIGATAIEQLAAAGVVQVDLGASNSELDVALRSLPWEYLLAAATRLLRGDAPFAIVRRLRVERTARRAPPRRWLMIQSAPGVLRAEYDFTAERELVQRGALANEGEFEPLIDPSSQALAKKLQSSPAYDVIHLAGFDTRQALEVGKRRRRPQTEEPLAAEVREAMLDTEGLILAFPNREQAWRPVPARELAGLLCSGPRAPQLVTCNIYNSAYQTAREIVAAGAQAAIGFQDTFDDQLAEEFFATFFRVWSTAQWNSISAFSYAWQQIRASKRPLQGSGLVLWTQHKLEGTQPITEEGIRKHSRRATELSATNVRDLIQLSIDPMKELNYSILHNNGPLFRKFVIKKKDSNVGEVSDLEINVELNVGTDNYRFRTTASLGYAQPQDDLSPDVRVSLAATLNRALRENVRTSLFVEVLWHEVTLHRETYPVTLLSVDEWRDDDTNRKWLPSFVLPRDPVVPQIIDRAQKYLMALLDDPTAGFDGYQSADETPGRKLPATACLAVDLQVRAIWSALIYDTPLSYINPPPVFTESSQRLRTPSDVILGKRGTCIDLALLLASCLEYVEIYPAIILLKTHAFPAYWRHSDYHLKFSEAQLRDGQSATERSAADDGSIASRGQTFSWYFDQPGHYREIVNAVQSGRLVPLETVWLTTHSGYAEALEEGYRNLGSRREFDSMLDIQLARTDELRPVTPLPILRVEA
jgi:hypothetical protein